MLEDVEAAFEIEVGDHFVDQFGVAGVFDLFEYVEELFAAGGELVGVVGIDGDVRGEVIELGASAWIVLGANDDGDRGGIEMEQGMDGLVAGDDGDGAAGFQELDVLHFHGAEAEVGGDGAGVLEFVVGVNAGAVHDVECAGKFVLVNGGGSVEPEQELDVKLRVAVDDDLGLAEWGIGLRGLVFAEEEIAHDRGEIDVFGGRPLFEGGAGDFGELGEGEVFALPMFEDGAAEVSEEWGHGGNLPWS